MKKNSKRKYVCNYCSCILIYNENIIKKTITIIITIHTKRLVFLCSLVSRSSLVNGLSLLLLFMLSTIIELYFTSFISFSKFNEEKLVTFIAKSCLFDTI